MALEIQPFFILKIVLGALGVLAVQKNDFAIVLPNVVDCSVKYAIVW